MICPDCGNRWAAYPKKYFQLTATGYKPKNEEAKKRRKAIFDSDHKKECGCTKDKLDAYDPRVYVEEDQRSQAART